MKQGLINTFSEKRLQTVSDLENFLQHLMTRQKGSLNVTCDSTDKKQDSNMQRYMDAYSFFSHKNSLCKLA